MAKKYIITLDGDDHDEHDVYGALALKFGQGTVDVVRLNDDTRVRDSQAPDRRQDKRRQGDKTKERLRR